MPYLQKYLAPVLKNVMSPQATVEEYVQDFGYLGPHIHQSVERERRAPQISPQSQQSRSMVGIPQAPRPQLNLNQVIIYTSYIVLTGCYLYINLFTYI